MMMRFDEKTFLLTPNEKDEGWIDLSYNFD